MESVLRAVAVYLVVLLLFRAAGKRTLSEVTTFDFVLLLIIAESAQQALLGENFSVTNTLLVVAALIGTDIALSLVKRSSPKAALLLEGTPLVLVEDGKPLRERMDRARVDDEDVLTAARELQGLERMDQIKYAVLERHGGISIVPKRSK